MRLALPVLLLPVLVACENTSPAPASAPAAPLSTTASPSPSPVTPPATAAGASASVAPATPSAVASLDTRPACTAAAMDLASVVRDCPCRAVLSAGGGAPLCDAPDATASERAARSLVLHADVPPTIAAGSTTALTLRLENTGSEPVPLLLRTDAPPYVALLDAKGDYVSDLPDPACPPMLTALPSRPESHVVLPPGGVLTASTTFQAIRHKHTKVKVTGPAGPGDVASALGGLGGAKPETSHMECGRAPAGPLSPGDYALELQLGIEPRALSKKVEPRVPVHVR